MLIGILIALDLLGASSLVGAVLGSAGVIGLVLGFAFKDIAENYIAGILLSLRRPFAPGDHVVVDRVHEGKVVALTSRATLLMTLDGNQVALAERAGVPFGRAQLLGEPEAPLRFHRAARSERLRRRRAEARAGQAARHRRRARGSEAQRADRRIPARPVEGAVPRLGRPAGATACRACAARRCARSSPRSTRAACVAPARRRPRCSRTDARRRSTPCTSTRRRTRKSTTQLAEAQRKSEDVNLLDDKGPATPE